MSSTLPTLPLPCEASELLQARAAAEEAGDLAALAELRDLERSAQALPQTIDGVRRTRLLAWDAATTTWEGWEANSGQRVVMRCLRKKPSPCLKGSLSREISHLSHLCHISAIKNLSVGKRA